MATAAKYISWLGVALVLATFAYHKYEACYQCGAVRHVFLTTTFRPNLFVEDGPLSDAYRRACGDRCEHVVCEPLTVWFYILHGDCVPTSPVFRRGRDLTGITRLPKPEWQAQVLLAIGHRENVLKWVAAMVAMDASCRPPTSDSQWAEWWSKNRDVFRIEKNPQRAAEAAKSAIERCRETTYPLCEDRIVAEVPALVADQRD